MVLDTPLNLTFPAEEDEGEDVSGEGSPKFTIIYAAETESMQNNSPTTPLRDVNSWNKGQLNICLSVENDYKFLSQICFTQAAAGRTN